MNRAEELALLEMFADLDTVFSEGDAFDSEHNRRVSLGRCLRAWRRTRHVLAQQSYIPYQQRIPSAATGEHQPQGREHPLDGEHHPSGDDTTTLEVE